jgi:hypothetical protein
MSDEPEGYQAYMLRLWRARSKGQWQWHTSLESPHTGERQVFASPEQLFAFLGERCASQTPDTPPEKRPAAEEMG